MTTQLATDNELTTRVRECYDADQTLSGGGVTPATVAAGLPIKESTATDRLATLADEGDLERDWGFTDGGHQLGYRPATDRSVETPGAPHTAATGGAD